MARLRLNNIGDPAGTVNPITVAAYGSGSSACSWGSSPGFATTSAALPTNAAQAAAFNYYEVTLNPGTLTAEICWLYDYTSGGTTGTLLRACEGSASLGALTNAPWDHSSTVDDFVIGPDQAAPTSILGAGAAEVPGTVIVSVSAAQMGFR